MIVLVAGASSGLGRHTAACLAAAGHTVYAGARSFAGGAIPPEGCHALALDVTREDSVRRAVEQVIREAGRIDMLVNCAAFFVMAPAEEMEPDKMLSMLDTDFVGMTRMVQAVLPQMRRQGAGRIVNFSSLNGRFAIPFQGAYCACKHAVEGWSEALQQEVGRFGISVTIVEPGDCRGGSAAYRIPACREGSAYADAFREGTECIRRDEGSGMDPDRVGRAVARLAAQKRPPLRCVVSPVSQSAGVLLHAMLPGRLFCRIIERHYRGRPGAEK